MPLHLIKYAVGCSSLQQLAKRQQPWLITGADGQPVYGHRTRFLPKRRDEVEQGGSMYWIIKGEVLCRQSICGFESVPASGDDKAYTLVLLNTAVIPVEPVARRPHQGWRYLLPQDAPADLSAGSAAARDILPPEMLRALREVGLM